MLRPTKSPKKPISVLHTYKVYMPDVFGGIPYIIEQLLKIRSDKLNQSLLVCSEDTKAKPNQSEYRIERVYAPLSLWSLPIAPSYPYRLWKKLRESDVIVLHAPFPLADLVFGCGLMRGAKLIVFWHSDIVRQRLLGWLLKPLLRSTLKRATTILVSHKAVISPQSVLAEFSSKTRELSFPIDISRFRLNHHEEISVKEIQKKFPNLVISVGRLVSYKGFEVLIQAAQQFDAPVCIIGQGPKRLELESLIKRLKLDHRVFLLGAVDERELILYLMAAEIFVLPSVSSAETFGIVQLEAMATKNAIINTSLPTAVPEIARHGLEALTVAPENINELASAVKTLLSDTHLRQKLQTAGLVRSQQFSDDSFSKRFITIVEDCKNES